MTYLVLVRHGQSEYNKKNLWTGWNDSPLADEGKLEAQKAGEELSRIQFDVAFVPPLSRCTETLEIIKNSLRITNLKTIIDTSLNERNYGEFTGKNKLEVKKELGDEEFFLLRRSWNYPVPGGESLKQVYDRVVPYYTSTILPYINKDQNVLIVSCGNALRALVKYLEEISDENIAKLEIATGEVYIYKLHKDGSVISKEIRAIH